MVHTKELLYVCLVLTFPIPNITQVEYFSHDIETPPTYDPRLTEFVWFSSSSFPIMSDNTATSNNINILPIMLPGPVDTIVAVSKDKNKVPKVMKNLLRLK